MRKRRCAGVGKYIGSAHWNAGVARGHPCAQWIKVNASGLGNARQLHEITTDTSAQIVDARGTCALEARGFPERSRW